MRDAGHLFDLGALAACDGHLQPHAQAKVAVRLAPYATCAVTDEEPGAKGALRSRATRISAFSKQAA